MKSPLVSLLARATGQSPSGLRPRLAARYEGRAVAGEGFQEVAREQVVLQPISPGAEPPPATPQASLSGRVEAGPAQPSSASRNEARPPAPDTLVPDRPAVEQATPIPRPPPPEASAPSPLLPRDTTGPASPPAPSAEGRRPVAEERGIGAPPAPLLSPEGRVERIVERFGETAPAEPPSFVERPHSPRRGQPQAVEPATPEPPEIVISIGRIDLRAPPAAAKPAPARRPQPTMTDLGDYLRSKGGKR